MKTAADYSLDEALERAFERKRANFVADYKLGARPALVFQCMPSEPLVMDVANELLREVVRDGAASLSGDGWWCGFNSGRRPVATFDGLASSTAADAAGWVTEVHVDGHLIAGIWTFPEVQANSQTPSPAVADFYTAAFRDFGFVANKAFEVTACTGGALLTCTMLHSNQLPFVGSHGRILMPAVSRSELHWPILTVESLEDISTACAAMAAQFLRTYGRGASKT